MKQPPYYEVEEMFPYPLVTKPSAMSGYYDVVTCLLLFSAGFFCFRGVSGSPVALVTGVVLLCVTLLMGWYSRYTKRFELAQYKIKAEEFWLAHDSYPKLVLFLHLAGLDMDTASNGAKVLGVSGLTDITPKVFNAFYPTSTEAMGGVQGVVKKLSYYDGLKITLTIFPATDLSKPKFWDNQTIDLSGDDEK